MHYNDVIMSHNDGIIRNNDVKTGNNGLLEPECCFGLPGLFHTWFGFRVFIAISRLAAGIQIHLGARAHGVAPAAPLPLPAAPSPLAPPAARRRQAAPLQRRPRPCLRPLPRVSPGWERAAAAALPWPALALPPQAFRAAMMSSRRNGVVPLVLAHDRFLRRFFVRALVCEKLVCEKQRKRIRRISKNQKQET